MSKSVSAAIKARSSTRWNELAGAMRDAIQTLPDDQRTATRLYEYEDAAYTEIASVLGCSVKAVEN